MKTKKNPNKKNEETQISKVLRHLQSGQSITYAQAFELYGILHLGPQIYRLRKRGYKIHTKNFAKNKNFYFMNDSLEYTPFYKKSRKQKRYSRVNSNASRAYEYLKDNEAGTLELYKLFKLQSNALISHVKTLLKDNEKLEAKWCKNPKTKVLYKVYRIVKEEKS